MGSYISPHCCLTYYVFYWLGNVVAQGTECAPGALTVSSDSRCLAFVGPSEYIVTIADARSLDEVCCTVVTFQHLAIWQI